MGVNGEASRRLTGRVPRFRGFGLRQDIPRWLYYSLAAASFAGLFALWAWLSHQPFDNKVFLPTPETVWETARAFLKDENLLIDVKVSVFRVTAGFMLAAALALPLGVWMGSYKTIEGLLQPPTEFVRYVPVPALIPMLMLVFGIGEMAKVMLIFAGTFFQ